MITRRGLLGAGSVGLVSVGGLGGCGAAVGGRLRIAAGDPAGVYIAFARLLARRLEARADGLRVEVQSTEGTADNVARVRSGRADLALGLADTVRSDRVRAPTGAPLALSRIYENYLQLVVTADSPVRRVEDLVGRRVSLGAAGSGAAVTGRVLLGAAGLGREEVRVMTSPLADGLAALSEDRVDALLWSGGIPTPAIARQDRRAPLRMVALGGAVAAMRSRSGFDYEARLVPDVGYAPQSPDARTVGVPNLLVARPALADEVARLVVEVLADDAGRLVPGFARGLQYLSPGTMIQTGDVPLHRGAVAGYRHLHG